MITHIVYNYVAGNITPEEYNHKTLDEALMKIDPTGEAAVLWDRDVAPTFDYTEFKVLQTGKSVLKKTGLVEVTSTTPHIFDGVFWRFYPENSTRGNHFVGWIKVNGGERWDEFMRKEYLGSNNHENEVTPETMKRIERSGIDPL